MLSATELNELTPQRGIIYVPVAHGRAHTEILPGSGIVGGCSQDGRVTIWYEGNANGACNLTSYESRIVCAAGRMFERYPTRAMMSVADTDLVAVGIVAWYRGLRPGFHLCYGDGKQQRLVRDYLLASQAKGVTLTHERAYLMPGYI